MSDNLRHRKPDPPGQMTLVELLSACARNREDSALWTEFLVRYGARIRQFIRGTLRLSLRKTTSAEVANVLGGMQPSDLFQSTIVRLVENDCAALKNFSGETEYEWLAYLAVITRSVVREFLRRQRAQKRPGGTDAAESGVSDFLLGMADAKDSGHPDRRLLAREVKKLGERAIHEIAGETSDRDLLIFRLYFDHDLSFSQISQWQNVNLSKTGVEKALTRLKELIRSVVSEESSKETTR